MGVRVKVNGQETYCRPVDYEEVEVTIYSRQGRVKETINVQDVSHVEVAIKERIVGEEANT